MIPGARLEQVENITHRWLDSFRAYPTRALESHLLSAAHRRGHVSRLAIIESIVTGCVAELPSLRVFTLENIDEFFSNQAKITPRFDSRHRGQVGDITWPTIDLASLGQESTDLLPGQDYRMSAIEHWREARPAWTSRYRESGEFQIVSSEDWLRTQAVWLDRTETWGRRIDTLMRFAHLACSGPHQRRDVIRDIRMIARTVGARDTLEGHFDGYVLIPRGNRVILRRLTEVAHGTLQFDNGSQLDGSATSLEPEAGSVTVDALMLLEELINSDDASEADFQRHFEQYPELLLGTDYERLISQPLLSRADESDLIPDFILLPYDESKLAKIIDIKLPTPKVFVGQRNRARFSSAVHEARAQLIQYREYFSNLTAAAEAKRRFGQEIFMPEMSVIIGRTSTRLNQIDVLRARHDLPDLELRTYDEIVASHRRLANRHYGTH